MKQPFAPNEDFAGSPFDILELESNHLTSTETETGKQEKIGIVAAADRGRRLIERDRGHGGG